MDLPPHAEKQPQRMPDPQFPPAGPAPSMGYGENPPMPPQYQVYYMSPDARFNQGPSPQIPQPVFTANSQARKAPDYLFYSIFTMIFCCLPLGIAALVYSIQTREANQIGDYETAKRQSMKARSFAHIALGLGIFFFIVYMTIIIVFYAVLIPQVTSSINP